jgi:hypothetical protein
MEELTIRPAAFGYTRRRSMKTKDIFALTVRIIGLFFLYQGLAAVPTAVSSVCPVFPHFYFRNLLPSIVLVGWPLLAAYWLVRGAPPVMRWAYPDEPAK